jgi:hypothetical protein
MSRLKILDLSKEWSELYGNSLSQIAGGGAVYSQFMFLAPGSFAVQYIAFPA